MDDDEGVGCPMAPDLIVDYSPPRVVGVLLGPRAEVVACVAERRPFKFGFSARA